MTVEPQAAFLTEYAEVLGAFWNRVKGHLLEWRSGYQWPPGASPAESTETRTRLERRIRAELDGRGCLSKGPFDAVIRWGFGTDSGCSDQEVRQATGLAFGHIRANRPAEAAMELLKLPRIGISRASKVLALSDQQEFGIYDSRSGHGLSDLALSGRRIIAIPPGRVIRGDSRTSDGYCRAFAEYTWVLRYFRDRACEDPSLRSAFSRAADLELAFFVRSRSGLLETTTRRPGAPEHLQRIADQDEENTFWTLGPGRKSTQFWAICDNSAVTILTGKERKTPKTIERADIEACLAHFGEDPFPLSNTKTAQDRDPRGLGAYFADHFGSSVFASHFAALWVYQGRLEATLRGGSWWFRVKECKPPFYEFAQP